MDIPKWLPLLSEGFPGSKQVQLSQPHNGLTRAVLAFAVGISSFQFVPGKVTFLDESLQVLSAAELLSYVVKMMVPSSSVIMCGIMCSLCGK